MITRLLPGLNDEKRLKDAHRLFRLSGILGCLAILAGGDLARSGKAMPDSAICAWLASGWTVAMIGACLLTDARGAVVVARRPGAPLRPGDTPLFQLLIALTMIGTGLVAAGIATDASLAAAIVMDAMK